MMGSVMILGKHFIYLYVIAFNTFIFVFSKNSKFLQEAVKRKHAADKEQNLFNQVTLYLEAVIYFILSGAVLEQHRNSEDTSWVMYKDTLNLIK